MGDEQAPQQRKVRISPEAREKIKSYGKKAAIGAGILVAGIAIGASIRACGCDGRGRSQNVPQPAASYCPPSAEDCVRQDGDLACFSKVMRDLFAGSDASAKYAVEMLYLISEGSPEEGQVDRGLVEKVRWFTGKVGHAARERSEEAFKLIRRVLIRSNMRGMNPLGMVEIVEAIADKAGDKDVFMDSLGIFSNRIETVTGSSWMEIEPLDSGMAERIIAMVRFVRERAGERHIEQATGSLKSRITLISAAEGIPAMIEIAVGDARGAEVARRIDSIPFDTRLQKISAADYLAGREMASELLGRQKPDLMSCLHFAYGISHVGREDAKRLHDEFGISYFMRYTGNTLREILRNASYGNPGRQVLLAVMNKNDWNDGFYFEPELEKMSGHYRLFVIEVMTEREFYRKAREISDRYGKIGAMIIGGHGDEDSINLGDYSEREMIDFSDEAELRRLKDIFSDGPTIVLEACSTGRHRAAIGGMLSRVFEAHLFAPTRPGGLMKYIFDSEGRISGVEYDNPAREYYNGETRVVPDASP